MCYYCNYCPQKILEINVDPSINLFIVSSNLVFDFKHNFQVRYIPYIESYLYRSVLMDVLFIVFVLGSIIYRSINRNIIIEIIKKEERKSERMQKILQIILFVFDIGIGFGLAELLINIKDVLIIL